MEFSRQEYWSGLPFPSPEDLLKPVSNQGLLHHRQFLYSLSHQGSPQYTDECMMTPGSSSWSLRCGRKCNGAATAKSLQSCPTLCNPIDGSPPGSAIPGILQARILEWAAISFSNAWKWKVKVKSLSPVQIFATPWTAAHQAPLPMGFSRQKYWSGVPLPYLRKCNKSSVFYVDASFPQVQPEFFPMKQWVILGLGIKVSV